LSSKNSPPAASPRLATQLVIPAAEVNQRSAAGVFGVEHFGDQDGVVAGVDHAMDAALEAGKCAGDERHTAVSCQPLDSVETVVPRAREVDGKILLVLAQYIDTDVLRAAEMRQDGGAMIHADQDQRRLQGNGCKGTRRHAVGTAFGIENGDDSDPGRKLRAGAAELGFGEVFRMRAPGHCLTCG
jgi:hypothetical protein